jgi:MioC protein
MSKIKILVATTTGTAQFAAEEAETSLKAGGLEAVVLPMDNLEADALDDCDTFLIVSSTYGHGDIPDNGQNFFALMNTYTPNLAGKRFAVFGLGDRSFDDTFCYAGEAWDGLFEQLGATRIVPLERHDACSGTLAEDAAGIWAKGLVTQYLEAVA